MKLTTVDESLPSARLQQQFLEGLAELDVENGVDERVEKAVDVAEPDEQRECERMNVAEAERRVRVVADADGVDDVDWEERDPAEKEHSYRQILQLEVSGDTTNTPISSHSHQVISFPMKFELLLVIFSFRSKSAKLFQFLPVPVHTNTMNSLISLTIWT